MPIRQELLDSLPPIWPISLLPQIQAQVQANGRKLFILDDDPLGCQTAYNLPIITDWTMAALRAELAQEAPASFILTNSRSLSVTEAEAVYETIGRSLAQLAAESGQTFTIVTRCDSTLRGHFLAEVESLQRGWQRPFAAYLFIPFFGEGGRLTIHDVHYVTAGEQLIPAAQTPYAQDALFGYHTSNLREWVVEKLNGRITPVHIHSLSLDDIRLGGPERVAHKLLQLPPQAYCIINAAQQRDIEVFVLGLLMAEAQGKQFLCRTAASFIPMRLGLPPRPLLTAADLELSTSGGGLIIVGSHVPQTTYQLQALFALPNHVPFEVNVLALLDDQERPLLIKRAAAQVESALDSQHEVILYTSRQLVQAANAAQTRQIGKRIAESLAAIVRALACRPRYLLVKGGITANDIATQALGVRRAIVLGQLLPGVPVWQLGPESRWPGLCFVVFPGNVGDAEALATAVTQLRSETWR